MADMTVEQLIDEMEVYIDNCRTTGVLGGGSMNFMSSCPRRSERVSRY